MIRRLKPQPRFPTIISALFVALVLAPGYSRRAAAQTTIDFEDLPANFVIGQQSQHYVNLGVVIAPIEGIIATAPKPHSGAHVLLPQGGEFYTGPFVITFRSGQSQVSLFAGAIPLNPNDVVRGTLTAFDGNGNKVGQDGPKFTVPNACSTQFGVLANGPVIVRMEIYLEEVFTNGPPAELPEAVDDLNFKGNPAPPLPNGPPVVQITAPPDQIQVDISTLSVTGTVSGSGLPPAGALTLTLQQAPNKPQAPPFVATLLLAGNGNTLNFATTLKPGVGPQTVTVQVTNDASLTGMAQIHLTNLPAAITQQFGASGGAATFGNVQWAVVGNGCSLAVYDHGAIANQAAATRKILGEIFNKWQQWILAKWDQLYSLGVDTFCPTDDEHDSPGNSRAQTFGGARIYTRLAAGTVYVPGVFVQAVETLGGEAATGVPLADPTSSPAAKTYLFQQFVRPGNAGGPSTLEIKGSNPALSVERQGGDLTALTEGGLALTVSSPTIVQQFPCSSGTGPCAVVPASSPPGVPRANEAGEAYCAGQIAGGFTPEWVAIKNDYVITPLWAIVVDSHMAGMDNALLHQTWYDGAGLPSDWVTLSKPIHPYKSLLASNLDMEVEIEEQFGHYFFTGWGYPQKGDLFFAAGRWIIDCGHPPFRSEIHPPFVTADLHTEGNSPASQTIANIWVNSFYTGDPVDIDLYPPPRPGPAAFLYFSKPFDQQAALDVQVSYSTDPDVSSVVTAHFSSSTKRSPVTANGEMLWQGGREYAGRWSLGWQTQNQYPIVTLSNSWWP
jgi:hypothetical protein